MNRALRRTILPVFILCCILALAGCKADFSAYADREILITGLTEEDFVITPRELSEMECVDVTAVGETEKAGTVKGHGPTLKTFVEAYGYELDDFTKIRATASDDYTVLLGPVTWDNYDVVLSISYGREPFDKNTWPLRLVIPGGKSGNWVRMVTSLEFTKKGE